MPIKIIAKIKNPNIAGWEIKTEEPIKIPPIKERQKHKNILDLIMTKSQRRDRESRGWVAYHDDFVLQIPAEEPRSRVNSYGASFE